MNEVVTRSPNQPELNPMIESYVPNELNLVELGKPPKTIAEAIYWGRTLAMSGLLPDSLRDKTKRDQPIKVADVVLLVFYGAELDLSPLQAVNAIYVVKGRPHISAMLWAYRIRKFGHKFTVSIERDAEGAPLSATARIVRGDDKTEHEVKFSIWDAERAGLGRVQGNRIKCGESNSSNKQPWEAWTERMLICRASAHVGRLGAPDAILSYGIQGEEYADELSPQDGFEDFLARKEIYGENVSVEITEKDRAKELENLAVRFTANKDKGKQPEVRDAEGIHHDPEERARRNEADKAALGAILKGVQKVQEVVVEPGTAVPRTGAQDEAWEQYVEASNEIADEMAARGIQDTPENNPLIRRTCEICGQRVKRGEHAGPEFDHDPVWIQED